MAAYFQWQNVSFREGNTLYFQRGEFWNLGALCISYPNRRWSSWHFLPSCTLGLAGWQSVDLHLGVLDGYWTVIELILDWCWMLMNEYNLPTGNMVQMLTSFLGIFGQRIAADHTTERDVEKVAGMGMPFKLTWLRSVNIEVCRSTIHPCMMICLSLIRAYR